MRTALNDMVRSWRPRNPRFALYLFGLVVALAATAIETFRLRYANYLVYTDSTLDFWHGVNPYTPEFVAAHGRYFLYTPVFSVLYLPIALLPRWLGPFVWNLVNYSLFVLAVFTLPPAYHRWKTRMLLFLLLILEQSVFPFQFNIVVAYCFLFSFSLLERGKGFWAVLLIMVSATTKVYGIVELLLLFCYEHPFRRLAYAALCGVSLLALPVLKTGVTGLVGCYENWWHMLAVHQSGGTFASLLYVPFLKDWLLPHYRLVQLLTVGAVIVLFFVQHRRWGELSFRATTLGVLMGWIILWGDSSETHTYLIALSGYMLWYALQERHTRFDAVLVAALTLFFGIVPVDVFVPASVHHFLNETLFIDVWLYAVVWVQMARAMAIRR